MPPPWEGATFGRIPRPVFRKRARTPGPTRVFDRVPWARPDILHKARRKAFGGKDYDDAVARLRLKQAFGRLVRRADDHGAFVLLDPMMPSRLFGAFPEGVTPARMGLKEAVEGVRGFLAIQPKVDEVG